MVNVTPTGEAGVHNVFVTAKATFHLRDGRSELEREHPVGLFTVDEETELGLLPNDSIPRLSDVFEVFALGQAHAPNGRPTTEQTVAVSVGDVTRTMRVFGDRLWKPHAAGLHMSSPEPYLTMPLVWERAFGGTSELWLDAESTLEAVHPLNPLGRGFDPIPYARGVAKHLGLPEGWPQVRDQRRLPNLERSDALVTAPTDDPEPCCWATLPHGTNFYALHIERKHATLLSMAGTRAHPDWCIPRPASAAQIEMTGLCPSGRSRFALPQMRLFVDHEEVEGRSWRELAPQRLLLLPESNALVLSFFAYFIRSKERRPRTLRLRAEEGAWPADLRFDGAGR